MNTIIQFLKNKDFSSNDSKHIDVSSKDVENINKLFAGKDVARPNHLEIRPKIRKSQIWTVKSEYVDFFGNTQKATHPLIVSIATDIDEMENEEFVRVFVVSPFVEMATEQDIISKDASIIGFPFLVEMWNEQPVLTEILDTYLGYYEVFCPLSEQEAVNMSQNEFRKIEISRAKYLNHSIMALVAFIENNREQEFSATISLFGDTQYLHYPKESQAKNVFMLHEPQAEYLAAAKSGLSSKGKCIPYQNSKLPFDIQIRKDDVGFIITVLPFGDIEIFDSNNKKYSGLSNKDRIVFSSLKNGLYTLISKQIKETIKIRLK
jgi:hypothetical protein